VQRYSSTTRGTLFPIAALCCLLAVKLNAASDPSANLLSAAASGQTRRAEMLLGAGANIETRDRNKRTPLMLAAQHGHAETVRLLLSKGAQDNARDADGLAAYALTFLFPAHGVSRANAEEVLKALPRPAPVRLIVDAATNPEDLVGSCFTKSREELIEFVNGIHVDGLVLSDFQDLLATTGGGLVQIVRADRHGVTPATEPVPAGDADAVLSLQVQPAASCVQATSDSLSLAIGVRVIRVHGGSVILQKTYGGGLGGLHMRTVTNPAQYPALYQGWTREHAGAISRDVVIALQKLTK